MVLRVMCLRHVVEERGEQFSIRLATHVTISVQQDRAHDHKCITRERFLRHPSRPQDLKTAAHCVLGAGYYEQ
jgi:hypothetical protein